MIAPLIAAGAGLYDPEETPFDLAFWRYENDEQLVASRRALLGVYEHDDEFDARYDTYRSALAATAGLVAVRTASLEGAQASSERYPHVITPDLAVRAVGSIVVAERRKRLELADAIFARDIGRTPPQKWFAACYRNGPIDVISGIVATDYNRPDLDAYPGDIAAFERNIIKSKLVTAVRGISGGRKGMSGSEIANALLANEAVDEHLSAQLIQEQVTLRTLVHQD